MEILPELICDASIQEKSTKIMGGGLAQFWRADHIFYK